MTRPTGAFPLVLASASPRRRRLIRTLPWRATVRVSGAREPRPRGRVDPRAWAVRLALLKARRAARGVASGLVLGVDTLVHLRGRVLGKPGSRAEAARTLRSLSGRWHAVHSGLALVARPSGREWTAAAVTRVKVRRLSEREVAYWSAHNHDKAGAYAAQSPRAAFVEAYRGDFDNVVGLPRRQVRRLLARARAAGYPAERAVRTASRRRGPRTSAGRP